MTDDRWAPWGAAAGAAGVALFVTGALVLGDRPAFDAPGAEVAAHLDEERTRIQLNCALIAVAAPLLVWFLSTVVSVARDAPPRAERAARVAYGCGLVYLAVFLVDVAALAVGALRPREPELALLLVDLEFLAIAMVSPLGAAMLAAFAVLSLRDGVAWPRWLGLLAPVAAAAYALRTGALFTTDGAFAADGVLGLYVPVAAFTAWLFAASVVLARDLARA